VEQTLDTDYTYNAGSGMIELAKSNPIPSPAEAAAEPPADGGAAWIYGDCVQSRSTGRDNPELGEIRTDSLVFLHGWVRAL